MDVMEQHLQANDFFVVDFGIADIALYAYTHVADEGGFDLGRYSAIGAWLDRMSTLPHHCGLAMSH
jgi:glutathione S-transferase